jgi:hypothetical protein
VKDVLTWPELHAQRSIDREPEHTQRDVEGTEQQRCPDRPYGVFAARHHAHREQDDAPGNVQHVVAGVAGIDRNRDPEPVEQHKQCAVEQQAGAKHHDVQTNDGDRIESTDARGDRVHGGATAV